MARKFENATKLILAATNDLRAWADARGFDGTVSVEHSHMMYAGKRHAEWRCILHHVTSCTNCLIGYGQTYTQARRDLRRRLIDAGYDCKPHTRRSRA